MADSPFANLGLNFLNWSSVPSLSEAAYAGQKGQKTLGGQLLGSALIGLAGNQSTIGQIGKDLQGQGAVLPSQPAAVPSVPAPVTAAPPAAPPAGAAPPPQAARGRRAPARKPPRCLSCCCPLAHRRGPCAARDPGWPRRRQ